VEEAGYVRHVGPDPPEFAPPVLWVGLDAVPPQAPAAARDNSRHGRRTARKVICPPFASPTILVVVTKTSAVVAISRQFGSGGARIGLDVAQRLGFKYADREILAEAARALDAETDELAPLEERVCGFWGTLAGMFSRGPVEGPYTPALPRVSEADLFEAERQIIETLADRGGAVIVGRGAAHILRQRPNVVRVFLHAPLEQRITVALEEYSLGNRAAADALVRASDAQRARFARAVTAREWCDATMYDIALNTATTGFERAAELIVDVVKGKDL
jgi:CMP/dCMP kinase